MKRLTKATPAESDPNRCEYCGQLIYKTWTAQGMRAAHKDSKMIFCTNQLEPNSKD